MGPDPPCEEAMLRGNGQPVIKYRGMHSDGFKKACISWGCTLEQPGEYE